jgi:spore maturation protein CgeB
VRFVIFTHSLVSDWNHGNAHFLRGIATELVRRGNSVHILEPVDGWSRENLLAEHGERAIAAFEKAYPLIRSETYREADLDLAEVLRNSDVVIVHEWNSHSLVRRIGEHHKEHWDYRLFFHDTHHRSVTEPASMAAYDLRYYDGVLAYGNVIRDIYQANGWTSRAWTWHEAADTNVFRPVELPDDAQMEGDLVWIGNWGDNERGEELREFLIEPVRKLRLKARIYGVRYPDDALDALDEAGIEYGGWLPNYLVPQVFSRYRVTVHVPRRPYAEALPGIPTIRPFEAMACAIPLISATWRDTEKLFRAETDFIFANTGAEMLRHIARVLEDSGISHALAAGGLETIRARHTCAHRVDELMQIISVLQESSTKLTKIAGGNL